MAAARLAPRTPLTRVVERAAHAPARRPPPPANPAHFCGWPGARPVSTLRACPRLPAASPLPRPPLNLKLDYDPALPITAHREEIIAALQRHQVLIVCGATGSGKTTQLPKLCLEAGRGTAA